MSYSRVFDEFAKILTQKDLVKTAADKKDESYNVVPPAAGTDTPVEETGYELVEIAHPEQVQVAESRLNDGVVENGVEKQKVMVDVALRNPRGVLAEVMTTLVKVANALEEEMTEESLKVAKEVDDFLVVLAQQSQVVLNPQEGKKTDFRRLFRLKELVAETLNRFGDLDWSILGVGNDDSRYGEKIVGNAIQQLEAFNSKEGNDAIASAYQLAQYVNQYYKMIRSSIQKSSDWGDDQNEAIIAWDNLKNESVEWLQRGHKVDPAKEQEAPGIASRVPGHAPVSRHNYSVNAPEVKELQQLVGAVPDGKFGKQTFAAVMKAAEDNYILKEYLHSAPAYMKGYQNWDLNAVKHAILKIKQFKQSTPQKQNIPSKAPSHREELLDPYPTNKELLNPYPEGYEAGWNAAKGQK